MLSQYLQVGGRAYRRHVHKNQTRILELASSTLCCICLARAVHHKHSTAQQLRFGFFAGGVGKPGEHFIQTTACTAVRTWACVGPEKALKCCWHGQLSWHWIINPSSGHHHSVTDAWSVTMHHAWHA